MSLKPYIIILSILATLLFVASLISIVYPQEKAIHNATPEQIEEAMESNRQIDLQIQENTRQAEEYLTKLYGRAKPEEFE